MLDQSSTNLLLLVTISGWRQRTWMEVLSCSRELRKHSICLPVPLLWVREATMGQKQLPPCQKWQFQLHKHWLQRWKIRLIIHAFSFFFYAHLSSLSFPFTYFPLHFISFNSSFTVWACLHLKKLKTLGLIWCHMFKINTAHMVFNQRDWIILVMMFWLPLCPLISCHLTWLQ